MNSTNGPLQFETVASSSQILTWLYEADEGWFSCYALIPLPADGQLHPFELLIEHKVDRHNYAIAGGDRAYRTRVKLSPSGDSCEIDVVIRYHDNNTRPATIFASQELEALIREGRY